MNKYEEALEKIRLLDCYDEENFEIKFENIPILQELVDRATPKKPVGKHTSYKCPVCDRRVRSGKGSSSFGVDHYCQRCGQTLDWSEDK